MKNTHMCPQAGMELRIQSQKEYQNDVMENLRVLQSENSPQILSSIILEAGKSIDAAFDQDSTLTSLFLVVKADFIQNYDKRRLSAVASIKAFEFVTGSTFLCVGENIKKHGDIND